MDQSITPAAIRVHNDTSGADVAWITDELDRPERTARLLTARARWDLVGGASGMVTFGVLGWATELATAIVISGVGTALLGLFVAVPVAATLRILFIYAHERVYA